MSRSGWELVSATNDARKRLDGFAAQWVELEASGPGAGQLPRPDTVVPKRALDTLSEHPVARAYRNLSWKLDVDPTKHRPAGEALARRVAQGEGLPTILPLVDAYNLASATTLVPLSAFDAAAVQGELVLDVARDGEAFTPIGRDDELTVEAGRPVWRDDEGIVAVVLYRDGQRTAIRSATERATLVAAGPASLVPRIFPDAFRVLETFASVVGWAFSTEPARIEL